MLIARVSLECIAPHARTIMPRIVNALYRSIPSRLLRAALADDSSPCPLDLPALNIALKSWRSREGLGMTLGEQNGVVQSMHLAV